MNSRPNFIWLNFRMKARKLKEREREREREEYIYSSNTQHTGTQWLSNSVIIYLAWFLATKNLCNDYSLQHCHEQNPSRICDKHPKEGSFNCHFSSLARCLHWLSHHFQTDWQNYERASWVRPATATLWILIKEFNLFFFCEFSRLSFTWFFIASWSKVIDP